MTQRVSTTTRTSGTELFDIKEFNQQYDEAKKEKGKLSKVKFYHSSIPKAATLTYRRQALMN